MQRSFSSTVLSVALVAACAVSAAQAQSTAASVVSELSLLPSASVVGAVSGAVVAVPVALSTAGAVLVVKTIEVSAKGTIYVLERVSDGARASVEVSGKVAKGTSVAVGTAVHVGIISAGIALSVAGEVIAFIPNEIGKALMGHEKVSK